MRIFAFSNPNIVSMIKKRLNLTVFAVSAILILSSCAGGGGKGSSFVTFDYSKVKEGDTLKFSSLAEAPEFIALDSDTLDAFAQAMVIISDNYLVKNVMSVSGMNEFPVSVFDRHTGRFICNVGHIGRGPGEYLRSVCTYVDEDGGKIWIMDAGDHIKTYDIRSGKYLGNVPLAYSLMDDYAGGMGSFIVNDGKVTVAAVPYQEDSCPSIVWCQDVLGNILWEIPETGRECSLKPGNTLVSSEYNIEGMLDVTFRYQGDRPDTLYLVREGRLQPVYNVNKRTLKSGMGMYDVLLPGKVFSNLTEDKEVIPNVTVGFPVACIVTDLNSGKSVKYPTAARNDFLGINTEQFSFQNGYLVQAVSAVEFKEIGQRALEQGLLPEASAEQVRAILSELQDTDNDVLMLARLKK